MKRKWKVLLSSLLTGTMIFGLSMTAFAADGEELAIPTGGAAQVTNDGKGAGWVVTNDDDAKAAATDDDNSQIGVFAKVSIAGASVYKVDIAWGAMKFSYTNNARVWNPTTHAYENDNEGTMGWDATLLDGTNNKVTIINHSNSPITTEFAYAHSLTDEKSLFNETPSAVDSVRGHFFTDNDKALAAALVLNNSATVPNELLGSRVIEACTEGATNDTVPRNTTFFTFNGTPDAGATAELTKEDGAFTKVGIITVTIGSGS